MLRSQGFGSAGSSGVCSPRDEIAMDNDEQHSPTGGLELEPFEILTASTALDGVRVSRPGDLRPVSPRHQLFCESREPSNRFPVT